MLIWMLMWFYYAADAPALTCEENKKDVKQIKPLSSCFSNADCPLGGWPPKGRSWVRPWDILRPCPDIFPLSAPEISAKTDVQTLQSEKRYYYEEYTHSATTSQKRFTSFSFPSLIHRPSQKSVNTLNTVVANSSNITLVTTQKPKTTTTLMLEQ
jgi:hypothetical protein